MTDIKTRVQSIDPNVTARDMKLFSEKTGSVYEAIAIIAKRSNQLNVDIKLELHQKLEEFAVTNDTIEEIHENKEQIEISKFYERLPNAAIIATEEYLADKLEVKLKANYRSED